MFLFVCCFCTFGAFVCRVKPMDAIPQLLSQDHDDPLDYDDFAFEEDIRPDGKVRLVHGDFRDGKKPTQNAFRNVVTFSHQIFRNLVM